MGLSFLPHRSIQEQILHLIGVKSRNSKKYELELDGVFSAAWSPNGSDIAFVGQSGSSSDIYILNIDTEVKRKVTDDIFSDSYPSWNKDGTQIAFVSDRGDFISGQFDGKIYNHDYSQTDIYTVNVESREIKRITNTEYNESHPVWSNTREALLYTADYNGVWNLFFHPLETYNSLTSNENSLKQYPITNVLTGLQQPTMSRDDNSLIFAGYSGIGWDLYSINNPLSLKKKVVAPTQFILNSESKGEDIVDLRGHKNNRNLSLDESAGSYSNWVFARGYESFNSPVEKDEDDYAAISTDTTKIDGQYIPKSYKTRLLAN